MHIEIIGNNFEIPDVLRTFAESRVWLAVHRAAGRVSWIGVRFLREDAATADGRVTSQVDVWLRGIGLVTVKHTDVNPYIALNCALVRLKQALVRRLREADVYAGKSNERRSKASADRASDASPRYAVVVVPRDGRPRLSLIPWLRARYGFQQLQTVALSWREWDALVAGDMNSPQLARFKDRLALAQLTRPEAVIVVGGASPQASCDERPQARQEIQRVVSHIRSFGLPIEVIGVWLNEHWSDEDCLLESEELPLSATPEDRNNGFGDDSDEELYAGLTSD
jgi:hypothetical protein